MSVSNNNNRGFLESSSSSSSSFEENKPQEKKKYRQATDMDISNIFSSCPELTSFKYRNRGQTIFSNEEFQDQFSTGGIKGLTFNVNPRFQDTLKGKEEIIKKKEKKGKRSNRLSKSSSELLKQKAGEKRKNKKSIKDRVSESFTSKIPANSNRNSMESSLSYNTPFNQETPPKIRKKKTKKAMDNFKEESNKAGHFDVVRFRECVNEEMFRISHNARKSLGVSIVAYLDQNTSFKSPKFIDTYNLGLLLKNCSHIFDFSQQGKINKVLDAFRLSDKKLEEAFFTLIDLLPVLSADQVELATKGLIKIVQILDKSEKFKLSNRHFLILNRVSLKLTFKESAFKREINKLSDVMNLLRTFKEKMREAFPPSLDDIEMDLNRIAPAFVNNRDLFEEDSVELAEKYLGIVNKYESLADSIQKKSSDELQDQLKQVEKELEACRKKTEPLLEIFKTAYSKLEPSQAIELVFGNSQIFEFTPFYSSYSKLFRALKNLDAFRKFRHQFLGAQDICFKIDQLETSLESLDGIPDLSHKNYSNASEELNKFVENLTFHANWAFYFENFTKVPSKFLKDQIHESLIAFPNTKRKKQFKNFIKSQSNLNPKIKELISSFSEEEKPLEAFEISLRGVLEEGLLSLQDAHKIRKFARNASFSDMDQQEDAHKRIKALSKLSGFSELKFENGQLVAIEENYKNRSLKDLGNLIETLKSLYFVINSDKEKEVIRSVITKVVNHLIEENITYEALESTAAFCALTLDPLKIFDPEYCAKDVASQPGVQYEHLPYSRRVAETLINLVQRLIVTNVLSQDSLDEIIQRYNDFLVTGHKLVNSGNFAAAQGITAALTYNSLYRFAESNYKSHDSKKFKKRIKKINQSKNDLNNIYSHQSSYANSRLPFLEGLVKGKPVIFNNGMFGGDIEFVSVGNAQVLHAKRESLSLDTTQETSSMDESSSEKSSENKESNSSAGKDAFYLHASLNYEEQKDLVQNFEQRLCEAILNFGPEKGKIVAKKERIESGGVVENKKRSKWKTKKNDTVESRWNHLIEDAKKLITDPQLKEIFINRVLPSLEKNAFTMQTLGKSAIAVAAMQKNIEKMPVEFKDCFKELGEIIDAETIQIIFDNFDEDLEEVFYSRYEKLRPLIS